MRNGKRYSRRDILEPTTIQHFQCTRRVSEAHEQDTGEIHQHLRHRLLERRLNLILRKSWGWTRNLCPALSEADVILNTDIRGCLMLKAHFLGRIMSKDGKNPDAANQRH